MFVSSWGCDPRKRGPRNSVVVSRGAFRTSRGFRTVRPSVTWRKRIYRLDSLASRVIRATVVDRCLCVVYVLYSADTGGASIVSSRRWVRNNKLCLYFETRSRTRRLDRCLENRRWLIGRNARSFARYSGRLDTRQGSAARTFWNWSSAPAVLSNAIGPLTVMDSASETHSRSSFGASAWNWFRSAAREIRELCLHAARKPQFLRLRSFVLSRILRRRRLYRFLLFPPQREEAVGIFPIVSPASKIRRNNQNIRTIFHRALDQLIIFYTCFCTRVIGRESYFTGFRCDGALYLLIFPFIIDPTPRASSIPDLIPFGVVFSIWRGRK